MTQAPTRMEHDLLGDRAVPAGAYYGVHTLRALENFPITGTAICIYPDLVRALACVKQAAALANNTLGLLSGEKAQAIAKACEEVREGGLLDEFVFAEAIAFVLRRDQCGQQIIARIGALPINDFVDVGDDVVDRFEGGKRFLAQSLPGFEASAVQGLLELRIDALRQRNAGRFAWCCRSGCWHGIRPLHPAVGRP